MSASDVLHPDGSDYDAFLYAKVGEDRPEKDNSMSEENQTAENQTVKHMASVKAAWDKAPEGPKKAAALKHYQAAEKAHEAENDEEAHNELKQASRALM